MKVESQNLFLVLDGKEREVRRISREFHLDESDFYLPLLPGVNGPRCTIWWPSAARLFNILQARERGHKVFYWGPRRFLRSFLQEASHWSRKEPLLWSQWERVHQDGVYRFYGALGVCLPGEVAEELGSIPVYIGNRFWLGFVEKELAQKGIQLVCRGRHWPAPSDELSFPKGSQKVTLALIVRNEEEFLAGCLEQALPFVDQIVVVDTGSQDRTAEIARAYGAVVIEYAWEGDFAAARNAYLREIGGGWILTVDADEYLTSEAGAWLRKLAEKNEAKVYYLRTYNYHNEFLAHFSDQANIRLFLRVDDVRYSGAIHEQLVTSLPRELVGGPHVIHYGYLPQVLARKEKLSRNVEILDKVTEEEDSPFGWYNKGLTLLSMNRPGEALDALEEYFRLESPGAVKYRPSAYWHAARAALACGKRELALEYAEKACEAPLPECYFTKAQVLEALGRTEEAIASYREAASLPDPPASLYQIFNQTDASIKLSRARLAAALLLEKKNRYAEAEQEYRRALENDVTNMFALLGLARTKRLQGRPREALKWAKRAVEVEPRAKETHLEYVEVLLALQSVSEAVAHIDQSDVAPSFKSEFYLRTAAAAADVEKWELALEAAEKALACGSENAFAYAIKARSLKELGRTEEAEKALEVAPMTPDVEYERGCLFLSRGELGKAEAIFRGVLANYPAHVGAATSLAQILVLKGRVEEALDTVYPFATSSSEELSSPVAAILAARCLNSLKRYVESLNLLSLVDTATLKPKELFEFHLVKGNAHFGLEQWLEAADCYFEAYRINPNDPELLFRIGLLMLKLERWEDAENAFLNAIHADPGNQEANNLLQIARHMRFLAQG